MTSMPRLVKLRSTTLLTSASSSGTICGRYSRTVTLTPTSWNMLANSTPTAPAPTMMMSLGRLVALRTSSLVTMRLPSGVRPGRHFTREPGRQDDVRRLEDPLAAGARRAVLAGLHDADLVGAVEPAAALDPGHLVLRDEALEPGPHPLDDRVLVGGHRLVVDGGLAGQDDAVATWRGGSGRRAPPTRAAPWSGCSRGGGTCRRSCPRRRGRPSGRAGRPGTRPCSRRCPRRARRDRSRWTSRQPWVRVPQLASVPRGASARVPSNGRRHRGRCGRRSPARAGGSSRSMVRGPS